AAAVPDYIALAEAKLRRRIYNAREELVRATLTLPASTETVALPADCERPEDLVHSNQDHTPIRFCSLAELLDDRRRMIASGQPIFATVTGSQLMFTPFADSDYPCDFWYWSKLQSLASALSGVNWLLTAHPDTYLYGALVESAPYLRDDDRVPLWK